MIATFYFEIEQEADILSIERMLYRNDSPPFIEGPILREMTLEQLAEHMTVVQGLPRSAE